ncbi:penicillin-binding protein 2 [Candidatus Endolissoclinum faulkneri L5]|uniref:Penicillin-binding protein 2 n=1 Tax=Candidatus Endolissoclinum faulkneri L5 TaxID=1401328 RepID=V9TUS0_9PROT|nr:penicillin-binding protein 2 [Candidatus Endolissoclinum faulkneri]AHC73902.1 penicillin-binding protein 2 [Candidatus Endolissoclinum faulkneri L5]
MFRVNERNLQKVFTRRAFILACGKLGLISTLAARLYYLQVVEGERYQLLSLNNQFNSEIILPVRGRIFDRHGVALADNQHIFQLEIVRERTKDVSATLSALSSIIDITERDIRRILEDVKCNHAFTPVIIAKNLTRKEIDRVAVNAPYLPGVSINVNYLRYYPFADIAVHIIGYVSTVSEEELTGDPVLGLPNFRIGKSGLEKMHESEIRGTAGRRQVEVNALGRVIRKLPVDDGKAGCDIKLTLDINLQRFAAERLARGNAKLLLINDPRAQRALKQAEPTIRDYYMDQKTVLVSSNGKAVEAESGAVVVIDVRNGALLVLASLPGYDPNRFNSGWSHKEWKKISNNPRGLLNNKAVSGQYPPGSTFKMLVMLAALESGKATMDTKFYCPGYLSLGNNRFHCWLHYGHGWIDMEQSIAQSCDVYYYDLANKIGIDCIANTAKSFGLGKVTGLDLPGESAGLIPTRDWKLATTGEPWHIGDTLVSGIGQGFDLATPLQLALMTARLANGGKAIVPYIKISSIANRPIEDMGINQNHLNLVCMAMYQSINSPLGTGRKIKGGKNDIKIAGKTGTAQVRRISMLEQQSASHHHENNKPWLYRDHSLFVGFVPVKAPRYAISVVVEHGTGGSYVAAPIAADVLREVMRVDCVDSAD